MTELRKYALFRKKVKFFDNQVDKNGIHTLNCNAAVIQFFPAPTCLGLAGFYHQFIQRFSLIAQLLTHLLKKNVELFEFEKEQSAFNHLKSALCGTSILAYPNFDQNFTLCTDTSGFGIGAVLIQQDDNGKYRVIAYCSRFLNKA